MSNKTLFNSPEFREAVNQNTQTDAFVRMVAVAAIGYSCKSQQEPIAVFASTANYTVKTTVVWLIERGCTIPADILASLDLEASDANHC